MTVPAGTAPHSEPDAPSGGFVLVHGGEHGPWCWDRMLPLLRWPATAVALPGRDARAGDPVRFGLDDSARVLADAVDGSGFDPCVVVCHSLGGLAVLAAEPRYRVAPAHRVFVAAMTPQPGAAGLDALAPLFRGYLRLRLGWAARRQQAVHLIPRWLARTVWFHDMSPTERRRASAALCAESPMILAQPTPDTPTPPDAATYLLLTRDRAMRPPVQRRMATNRGIRDVRRLDAAHEVMISRPELLADELNRIADEVATRHNESRSDPGNR